MSLPALIAAALAKIERRLQWRALAAAGFVVIVLVLAVMAAISVLVPVRTVTGLPDDDDVTAARALLHNRLPMRTGPLRFRSALTGEAPPGAVFGADEARLVERALPFVERAHGRHRGDPRLEVALAHLDLARQRYARAERRYRTVIDRGVDSPEARLGLGVTLALQAHTAGDPLRARALRLEAVAQFMAVDRRDPARGPALYDRALLLAAIGRRTEALRVAREHLERHPGSPWAERLHRELGVPGD